jgi:RNA-directed DNA polymerase
VELTASKRFVPEHEDFDLLKAILTNCVRHRPESQNRERASNLNPANGQRLRLILERIVWSACN